MPGLNAAARSSLLLYASMLGRTISISRQLRGVGAVHSIGAVSITRQTFSAACNTALCTNETGDPGFPVIVTTLLSMAAIVTTCII